MLAWLNYRGVLMTLNVNFVITALAYLSILILFFSVQPWSQGAVLQLGQLVTPENALPYGWIGVIAAFQFGIWYYLGIEGTTQAAEEVRSPARSLPVWHHGRDDHPAHRGGAHLVCLRQLAAVGVSRLHLLPALRRGPRHRQRRARVHPVLGNRAVGGRFGQWLHQRCGAGLVLARPRPLSADAGFRAVHPKYRTPYRSILFLLPIALAFAFIADLNQAITFSILSGVLQYTFMSINIVMFRKKWPLGTIRRGYTHPFHPIPAIVLFILCVVTFFAIFLGFGSQLIAMVAFYFLISLWFHFYRYKFVRRGDQFTMPWPKPLGY